MGQTDTETEGEARREAAVVPAPGPVRLCGRFTNAIDTKSRVVLPAALRAPFLAEGGFLTPWKGTCLAAMAPADFDAYLDHVARSLLAAGSEAVDDVLSTLWSSTVEFRLDVQGRMVLPEEVRSQVGITSEVRFQGRGRRIELWPGQVTADELDDRADHLRTLAVVQGAFIPELES